MMNRAPAAPAVISTSSGVMFSPDMLAIFFPEPGMARVVTVEQGHILQGKSKVRYLSVSDGTLSKVVTDEIISEAVQVISFSIGMRRYFKVSPPFSVLLYQYPQVNVMRSLSTP